MFFWIGLLFIFAWFVLWLGPLSHPLARASQWLVHPLVLLPGILLLLYHWLWRGKITMMVERRQEERRARSSS